MVFTYQVDDREKKRRHDRMVMDGSMIIDPNRWPGEDLHVKTQPWHDGPKEQGIIRRNNLRLVINKDGNQMNDHFDSISELVEKWSVD
jgi:hypothetical protein